MKIFPIQWVMRYIRGSPIPPKVYQKANAYGIQIIRATGELPYGGDWFPIWIPKGNGRGTDHCFLGLLIKDSLDVESIDSALEQAAIYFNQKPGRPQKRETKNIEEQAPLMLDVYSWLKMEGEK